MGKDSFRAAYLLPGGENGPADAERFPFGQSGRKRDSNADKAAFRIIAEGAALAAYAQETVAAD